MTFEPIHSPLAKENLQKRTKPKITRNHKTKPFTAWEALCKILGETPAEITRKIGYSKSSFTYWRKRGKVPEIAWFGTKQLTLLHNKTATHLDKNPTHQDKNPIHNAVPATPEKESSPMPQPFTQVFVVKPTLQQQDALLNILQSFSISFTII